jgi:HK97 family phage portal protein
MRWWSPWRKSQPVAEKRSFDEPGWSSTFSAHAISGIDINPTTALTATAVLACFTMLCEDFAKLDPVLYRLDANGGRVPAEDHELYPLLYTPNSYQNYFEWAEMMQFWLVARGNAYSVKIRDLRGRVKALIPVASDWVAMWEAPGGGLFYRVTPSGLHMLAMLSDEPFLIPAEDVLHIKGFSIGGLLGASRVVLAKEAIGLSLAYERQAAQWMGQGASVNGILTTDKNLTPDAAKRMAQDWKDTKAGLQNAGKVLVLEQGLKWQETAMTAVDAEFIASRGLQLAEIARVFRVPAHMIGDLSRSTNNNITQQAQEYINLTLSSYTKRWAWKLNVDFDLRAQGIFLDYDLSALTRADVLPAVKIRA